MKQQVSARNFGAIAALLVALACNAAAVPAQALEVAGVNFQPQSLTQGTKLQLNGAGVRQQAATPLYTAGLYLEKKASTAEEVLQARGAKQIRVVMLREVNSRDFGAMLSRGLVTNSNDDQLSNLIPEIMDLGTLIAERGKLEAGDSFVIDWSATQGTTIRVTQRSSRKPAIEVFAKPDVIGALMRIWLGEQPADAGLKAALLGKAV
jgi:hypothetical protein